MGDCSRIYPKPSPLPRPSLDVLLGNADFAWRYAFQKQQSALWERLDPLVQLTNDPTDVEMHEYGVSIGIDPSWEDAPHVAARVAESAEDMSSAFGAFVLAALLSDRIATRWLADVRVTDDEFQPLIREGEWLFTDSGDALSRQVVQIPPGESLAGLPSQATFETALFEAFDRANGNARTCGVGVTGYTLIASHQTEQRIRSAFGPRWGGTALGLAPPLGKPEPCELWFTPAIPHPDVAFLVPHVQPEHRAFEVVVQGEPRTKRVANGPIGHLEVRASLGFRVHRAPWVIKITSEDAEEATPCK